MTTKTTNTSEDLTAFTGILEIKKGVLLFKNSSILVKSIVRISNYPIEYPIRIRLWILILSALCVIGFLKLLSSITFTNSLNDPDVSIGKIITPVLIFPILVAGFIVAYGIWERTRPVKYGLTIELTSGYVKHFIDSSHEFIDNVYHEFVYAVQNNKDFQAIFNKQIVHGDLKQINANTVFNADNGSMIDNSTNKTHISDVSGEVNLNSVRTGDGSFSGDITDPNQTNK